MATPTQLNTSSMWYHDADAPISNTLSSPTEEVMGSAPQYGVCMDCGIGLDDANDFFYDRRQKQCDCFTCNKCFETTFGKDELFNAANWKTLGIQAPQYIRVSW